MRRKKKLLIFISAFSLFIFISLLIINAKGDPINYIYMDLNCGNVTISATTYTGCIYETIDGVTNQLTVTGTHLDDNYYYVYQSNAGNKSSTGNVDGEFILPVYESLKEVTDSFINEYDVEKVISTWKTEATSIGRTTTANRIAITGNKKIEITIDNIWSSYQQKSTGRQTGGIPCT